MLDRKTEELLNLFILPHFCQSQQRLNQIQALPNKREGKTNRQLPQTYQAASLQDSGFKYFMAATVRTYKATPTANNLTLQLLSCTIKPARNHKK